MAFDLSDVLGGVRASRAFFLKHLTGLTPDQWTWKPYTACKGVRDTLSHMITGDRMALQTLKGEGMPEDFEAFAAAVDAETADDTNDELIARIGREREMLLQLIESKYAGQPLDTPAGLWGEEGKKLGAAVAALSSEDYYHAGQIAFIRLATDPGWNYYGDIYGGG